ncbi:MAG: hypothetical protein EOP84_25690, partial [Verrucomicrobiaceae bacterium]
MELLLELMGYQESGTETRLTLNRSTQGLSVRANTGREGSAARAVEKLYSAYISLVNYWKDININSAAADSLVRYLVRKGTFVSPTLGPFEYQVGSGAVDSAKLSGFINMKAMTAKLNKAGVRLVLGSHSMIPYAEEGWAYQREMELWVESGIPNARVITGATIENARYFRIDDRLGSIEKGKMADLVLIKGNPLV